MAKAPDLGSGDREFESLHSDHLPFPAEPGAGFLNLLARFDSAEGRHQRVA